MGRLNWILGTLPVNHIFSTLEEVQSYLLKIDDGYDDGTDRWKFFDYLEK